MEEAVESYLAGEAKRERRRRELLSVAGALSKPEADELRRATQKLRESWR